MFGALMKVILFIVVLGSAALFIMWNQAVVVDLTLYPGYYYAQGAAVGLLPLVGMVAGIILMAAAAWGAYTSQAASAAFARAQVARAKDKLRTMASTIKSQQAELNALRLRTGSQAAAPKQGGDAEDVDDDEVI